MEGFVNLVYHFAIPQGRCYGNLFKVEKLVSIFFGVLPFRNGLQYRNSNFKILNGMYFSALCSIFVRFGSVTPEFILLKKTTFAAIQLKSAYCAKYLGIS